VEHVQPLERPFPWRTTLVSGVLLGVVALTLWSTLALAHRPDKAQPLPDTSPRVTKTNPVTPLRPRSRISVLVLNGNGVANAAGIEATHVLASGYRHAIPADAPSLSYARSIVLFRPGWEREATRLARDARIATVTPLDGRVPRTYAHVPLILILGR
jgi:hypothetical protein